MKLDLPRTYTRLELVEMWKKVEEKKELWMDWSPEQLAGRFIVRYGYDGALQYLQELEACARSQLESLNVYTNTVLWVLENAQDAQNI